MRPLLSRDRVLGIAFSALVFLTGAFVFSPRALPVFPATGVRVDTVLLLDAALAGARMVAAGERGYIFLSDDAGKTWRTGRSPAQSTLTALHFRDSKHGWAVGHDELILRTEDGGETWQQVHFAPKEERPLLDIWFRDERHGIAIGAYGSFLESSDGGRTWQARKIQEEDRHLNALAGEADARLFIAGESGTLLRSADSGKNWERVDSPYKGSFFGVVRSGENALVAFGLRGHVFRSQDAGGSWTQVDNSSQASLMRGRVLKDDAVVLVGQDGNVLVSRDGTRSFVLLRAPSGRALATVLEAENGDLLVFGEGGFDRVSGVLKP